MCVRHAEAYACTHCATGFAEELARARRKAEREADHAARAGSGPFKPANPPKRGGPGVPNTTISKGKGVAGEWEYIVGSDAKPEGSGEGGSAARSACAGHAAWLARGMRNPHSPLHSAQHPLQERLGLGKVLCA